MGWLQPPPGFNVTILKFRNLFGTDRNGHSTFLLDDNCLSSFFIHNNVCSRFRFGYV